MAQFNNVTSPLRTGITTGALDVSYPPQAVSQTACADGVYRVECIQVPPVTDAPNTPVAAPNTPVAAPNTPVAAPSTPVAAIAGGVVGVIVLVALGWYCWRRPAANTIATASKHVEMVPLHEPASIYQTQMVFGC